MSVDKIFERMEQRAETDAIAMKERIKKAEAERDQLSVQLGEAYNRGLEAAAQYHDKEEQSLRNLRAAFSDSLASRERDSAKAIRAMKDK